jgi:Na+/H+-dicarboxylate symporter
MVDPAPHLPPPPVSPTEPVANGVWARWKRQPLYLRILIGFGLGVVFGLLLGTAARWECRAGSCCDCWARSRAADLVAVVQALMQAEFPKGAGNRLLRLLLLNTVVAICVGLFVANTLQPGRWSNLAPPEQPATATKADPLAQFLDNVPRSLLGPFTDDGKVIGVIVIALALGIALRRLQGPRRMLVTDLIAVAFEMLLVLLHWIIEVIPLAVFGVVASIVGTKGFSDFIALGGFVVAVILALLLQTTYYLLRIRMGSWARPGDVLRGMRDALVMAFSTASSTATMPLTYDCLRHKVGLRERSASMGALVGANFNNDGTALYEAMSALFVSQLLGMSLSFWQQLMVVLTSIAASVGAAGIPEAGLVTMTLVFNAVGLPTEFIALLLTVDWFLDRCRTMVNVMGDVNVSCLLDGQEREAAAAPSVPAAAGGKEEGLQIAN